MREGGREGWVGLWRKFLILFLGLKLPRTKPPPELVELLEELKLGGGREEEGEEVREGG